MSNANSVIEILKKEFPSLDEKVYNKLVSIVNNWFDIARLLLNAEPDASVVKAFVATTKASLHLLMVKDGKE